MKHLLVLLTNLFDLLTAISPFLHGVEENQQTRWLLDNDPLRVQELSKACQEGQAIGEARVISASRNQKGFLRHQGAIRLEGPKEQFRAGEQGVGEECERALPPSAARDSDGRRQPAADAAQLLSHMIKTMVARDRMVRLLSHKSRDRYAHLSRAASQECGL